MYLEFNDYVALGGILEGDVAVPLLKKAERNINALTFNRIVAKGFDNLSLWQQDIIKEVIQEYVEWMYSNEALLNTYLKSYSINGTSMTIDGAWNVCIARGVAIPMDLYTTLENTGLCNLSVFHRF